MPTTKDRTILEAALLGLEAQKQQLDQKTAEIRQLLSGDHSGLPQTTAEAAPRKRRKMSAAAKKRIAEAQRKRWEAFHKQHGQKTATKAAVAPTKPKRKLSAAAKAKLVANLKKARAAKKAKAAAG